MRITEERFIFVCKYEKRMIIEFDKTYLLELYENGTTKDKKHRFQPDIVKRYKKAIDMLKRAKRIEDLFFFHSLNYEMLTGNKTGVSSIRVNDKYRIEFIVEQSGQEPIVSICNILELSNHYK